MNYSEIELSGTRIDEEALIEAGLQLLPVVGASLYSAISQLGHSYHLTPAQVKVLLHLGSRGQMTVGDIAAALAISMPAASELVDRLVDGGHVVRSSDPSDRRRVLICATPESQRIGVELRELRRSQLRFALDQLASDERPTFIRSLQALVAALTQSNPLDSPSCGSSATSQLPSREKRFVMPVPALSQSHEESTDD